MHTNSKTQTFGVIFQVDCVFFYLIHMIVFWTLSSVSGYNGHKFVNTGSVFFKVRHPRCVSTTM